MFKKRVVPYILVIVAIASVIFATTLNDRAPWRGQISDDHHQLITAESVKFASNWYFENPLTLKFALLELPKSVENPTLQDRDPYVSYAPGAFIPIYLIAKAFHHPPTVYLVHDYNLLNHFLIGLALAAIAFSVARGLRLSYKSATVLAIIPLFLEYLLPGPMYFHQNVFFTDTAVILPATLLILFEVWRYFKQTVVSGRILFILQAALLFYGTFTDWYFIFLALGIFLLRILWGEYQGITSFIKKSIAYWLPVAAALSLFVLQLSSLNGGGALESKFFARTSAACSEYPQFTMGKNFWHGYISESFGSIAVGVLWLGLVVSLCGLAYIMYRKLKHRFVSVRLMAIISAMSLLVVVPFVRVYALRCHSIFHDFTTMFFAGAVALVPFVLLPLLLSEADLIQSSEIKFTFRKHKYKFLALPVIALIFALTYTVSEHYRFIDLFPPTNPTYVPIGEFVADRTNYYDVVVSPDYEAAGMPSQQIIYTHKPIHKVKHIADIQKLVKNIYQPYTIKVFVKDKTKLKGDIALLVTRATHEYTANVAGGQVTLYDIPVSALTAELTSN